MATLKQKRAKVLQDTIDYYGQNPNKKLCKGESNCKYDGKTVGKDTEGCAVGRLLSPRLRAKLDKMHKGGASVSTVFNLLPKKIQDLGEDFLEVLQNLHDERGMWGVRKGLSKAGKELVKRINARYID